MKKKHEKKSALNKYRKYLTKRNALLVFIVLYFLVFTFNISKPLPENVNYESPVYDVKQEDIALLYDLTYINSSGSRVYEQEIFDNIFSMIDNSKSYLLIDMFLFNPHLGKANESYLPLSYILSDWVALEKETKPSLNVDFVTDDINTVYGGSRSEEIERMRKAGVEVHITNLNKLRDSNPIYSTFWRLFIIGYGNSEGGNALKHPFAQDLRVSVRSYLKLMNFKANHRKVVTSDSKEGGFSTIITSANPHDGSSAHSNIGIKINGSTFASYVYEAEKPAANFNLQDVEFGDEREAMGDLGVSLITEKKIRDNILDEIKQLEEGDSIDIAVFYMSERKVIKALKRASKKGIDIRIILDPNKDAFGFEKNGIPNRQVAHELVKKSKGKIQIKWYNTNGEQFHTKLVHIKKKDGTRIVILGSANFTKRNIGNYNLEMNVKVEGSENINFFREVDEYFERIWGNQNGDVYTLEYENFEDTSFLKYWFYRFQEFTGLSTF